MNNYFKKAEEIGLSIHNMILPLIKPIQPMALQNCVDLSSLKEHNKKYLKTLFKKYTDYCKKDLFQ